MDSRPLRFHEFARLTELLGSVAREEGLVVPGFRSPPRRSGLLRSIRRDARGTATVAVALRGRPAAAVVADLLDGIVAVNALDDRQARRLHTLARARLAADGLPVDAAPPVVASTASAA